jgi:hypothetical protein
MSKKKIRVKSHVGRDLLSSAAAFKTEAAAVWEYVANSLQYVDSGTLPVVQVSIDSTARQIRVGDNGRGMSVQDLRHFFTMHGENQERIAGRPGRGKFGTGKSAAFGIGNKLTIETVRDGSRNVVELRRKTIEQSDGKEIPVSWLTEEEPTNLPNGTIVTIGEIFLTRLRTNEVVEYIERHLQAYRANQPSVAVNDHVCEHRQPETVFRKTYMPTPSQAKFLGECELTIKVSRVPLSDIQQGIVVTAGAGNHVGTEDAGIGRKEFGNYLFGEIDVPALETFDTPIQPFDDSRSLKLNPEHPVVRALIGFIGSKLEEVRLEQVRLSREANKTEQMRRLSQEAEKISEFLNRDFEQLRDRLQQIRAAASSRGPTRSLFGSDPAGSESKDQWQKGTQERGTVEEASSSKVTGKGTGRHAPDVPSEAKLDPKGEQSVDPVGGNGSRQRPRGGFRVSYKNMGREQPRSEYDRTGLAILINLDHPAVANALKNSSSEDPIFKRLSYEIAFSEYAMALGHEFIRQDPDMPADDLLFDVRATLNRVARSAAPLYLA